MRKFNAFIIKNYLWLIVVFLMVFTVFIYLEKNNNHYSIVLNNDRELSAQSLHVLNQLNKNAIVFDVFTNPKSPIAKKISQFFIPYIRNNNTLEINFIDPVTNPSEVKLNAITIQGEMIARIKNSESSKKIHITELSETSIINAILSLLRNKDEWVVVGEGFGMSNIDDDSPDGLSSLLIHLKKIGFQIARMPLNKGVVLPENVKVIILPAPTEVLGVEIVEWLKNQTEKGISLWWLNDLEVKSQTNMELVFDVMISEKILLQDNEYTAYVSTFPNHAITENFNQPIYIAQAREIIADEFLPLFINDNENTIAVSKQLDDSRIVITGDTDFIRNQFINVAANKSMLVRIVDWLLYNDDRVNIPLKLNQNTQLLMSQNQLLGLSLFFLILLPLIFVFIALVQWRKNHAS